MSPVPSFLHAASRRLSPRSPTWMTTLAAAVAAAAAALATAGCSEGGIGEVEPALGGSCLGCHQGITNIHPAFALACVDCHGGNDAVLLPASVNARDQKLLKKSHVMPKRPELWWPNGIDDNSDGRVDEPGEFFDGRAVAPPRLAARGQQDSEQNRDLNYLRFLNPGDLRVAEVGCGGRNRNANAAMVCHAGVVYDVRRSIMAVQAGVPAGALYGNAQLPRAADYGSAFASSPAGQRFDARNPRIGRAAYAFDHDSADIAYDAVINRFLTGALLAGARSDIDDENDAFEIRAGALHDDGSALDPAGRPLDPGPGFTRTQNRLRFFDPQEPSNNRAIEVLQPVPTSAYRSFPAPGSMLELRVQKILGTNDSPVRNGIAGDFAPLTNPVDAALRVFRAYHTLNSVGPNDNFGFVDFFESPDPAGGPRRDPDATELKNNNNPFGRFRPSGCSACHITYARDGRNREPVDRTVADNGRQPETALPFGIRQDLGQRAYAERHLLRRAVQSEACASCHGFVTRVDYALTGKFELETDFTNLEKVQTLGPFTFATPRTPCVQVFDNLAHFKDGVLVNDGERKSEDLNNNGELDSGEDLNNNGCLDVPDRVARSEAFDGRQTRIVYGGANGSTRLIDVHIERGMGCVDCHVTSVHGDSNIYTRNWDAEPMECEDCHGTPTAEASLMSSGPNGGDVFTSPVWTTPFGKPWFERRGGKIVQHSRQTPGLSWEVSQLVDEREGDPRTAEARYAHRQPLVSPLEPGREGEARALAHIQEGGKPGGLECYACHSAWQPNCLTCHMKMDVEKPKQEIWFGDDDVEDVFFQLFSYARSPFYMGRAGDVEGNKIAPYRSTQQVHLSIVAGDAGMTIVDNAVFATAGGLSSMVSNPYFPHTVRRAETKSCARCHTLEVPVAGGYAVANDHLITEATGQGSGRYMNVGDWAALATADGIVQLDIKKETRGLSFPGFDIDSAAARRVAFPVAGVVDVALLRGVSFTHGSGDITDVAIAAHAAGVSVVDVFGRDNAGLPPKEIARVQQLGAVVSVDVVDAAASQSRRFIALSQDELCAVDFTAALEPARVAAILDGAGLEDGGPREASLEGGATLVGCVAHGKVGASRVRLHGRFAVMAHADGLSVFALGDAATGVDIDFGAPIAEVASFFTDAPALDVATSGRFAWAATGPGGVLAFDIGPVVYPLGDGPDVAAPVVGAPLSRALVGLDVPADARGLAVHGSRLLVADGNNGLRILDVAVPADPVLEETIREVNSGPPIDQASAVAVATEPTRTFALVADGEHGLRAVNLTAPIDMRLKIKASLDDPAAHRGFRLSPERHDPLTPFDPKNSVRQVVTFAIGAAPVAIARGLMLDNIADKSGRRLRDAWSIGADTLDERTVARMRAVRVREVPGTRDRRGDGLGCVVRAGEEADVARDPADGDRCLPSVREGDR